MSKGLGRGLSALISEKPQNQQVKSQPEIHDIKHNILDIEITNLEPGEFQPRQFFKEDELHELANSIKQNGVFQPILARKKNSNTYEIIAGERRWRASKIAGKKNVPVIIMDIDDKQALEIAIIENVQRQNLLILEEAQGYTRLIEEFNYTQEELAQIIGKSRSAIANNMRLLKLPDDVKDLINDEKISAGHARALLSAKDPISAAEIILKKGLNVRQTEAMIKKELSQPKIKQKIIDTELEQMRQEVCRRIGHEIKISNNGNKGKVSVYYSSLEELELILKKLVTK